MKPVRILNLESPVDSDIWVAAGPWSSYGFIYYVEDSGFIVRQKHYPYVSSADTLKEADLQSLESALDGWGQVDDDAERIFLAEDDGRPFHPDDSDWIRGVWFEIQKGRLVGVVEENFRDEASVPEELGVVLSSALAERGCNLASLDLHKEWSDTVIDEGWLKEAIPGGDATVARIRAEVIETYAAQPRTVRAAFGFETSSGTTRGLLEAALDLQALLRSHSRGGGVSVGAVRAWLRAKRFALLKGIPESEWLEIKSQSYKIGRASPPAVQNLAKVELAQDVARFANGSHDALLILGYSEQKLDGADVVGALTPVPFDQVNEESYRNVLDHRIVPPLEGVTIEKIESATGEGVVLISIPKQAEEMQPYLVHGAVAEGKYEGEFFSIVQRRGEGSITTNAQQIHAYIVAGRRYLRGN